MNDLALNASYDAVTLAFFAKFSQFDGKTRRTIALETIFRKETRRLCRLFGKGFEMDDEYTIVISDEQRAIIQSIIDENPLNKICKICGALTRNLSEVCPNCWNRLWEEFGE